MSGGDKCGVPGIVLPLFDECERADMSLCRRVESDYEYLNRSGRPEIVVVRNLLEKWYKSFPHSERSELQNRMRGDHFSSAFYELYCFMLLSLMGFVVQPHPQLPGTSKKPDFLASQKTTKLLFEATLSEKTDEEQGIEKLKNVVYDSIDEMDIRDYFLSLQDSGNPRNAPSENQIKGCLKSRIAALNYDDLRARYEKDGLSALPEWPCEFDGYKIVFQPIPKNRLRGEEGIKTIGIRITEWMAIEPVGGLRRKLKKKADRYPNVGLPLIVAVNSFLLPDKTSVVDALFGDQCIDLSDNPTPSRAHNGIWIGPRGPKRRKLTAVVVNRGVTPWTIAREEPELWLNPWAENQTSFDWWPFTINRVSLDTRKIDSKKGISAHEFWGLPANWPET